MNVTTNACRLMVVLATMLVATTTLAQPSVEGQWGDPVIMRVRRGGTDSVPLLLSSAASALRLPSSLKYG